MINSLICRRFKVRKYARTRVRPPRAACRERVRTEARWSAVCGGRRAPWTVLPSPRQSQSVRVVRSTVRRPGRVSVDVCFCRALAYILTSRINLVSRIPYIYIFTDTIPLCGKQIYLWKELMTITSKVCIIDIYLQVKVQKIFVMCMFIPSRLSLFRGVGGESKAYLSTFRYNFIIILSRTVLVILQTFRHTFLY